MWKKNREINVITVTLQSKQVAIGYIIFHTSFKHIVYINIILYKREFKLWGLNYIFLIGNDTRSFFFFVIFTYLEFM